MLLTPGVISGLLWSLASLIILSDERGRGWERERESFGKCYGKGGGDGHAALFRKLFLIVAVWRRQVSQWQRSKNKTLSIRLWNFSKCLHPLLVDLREEGLLEVEKIFLFHWLEQCPYFFSANYFGAFKPDMFSGLSVDTKKKKKKGYKHEGMSCATGWWYKYLNSSCKLLWKS